jgi:pimeloyl-ACP methyl ester carboxylesterase
MASTSRTRRWIQIASGLTGAVLAVIVAGYLYEEMGRRRDRDRLPRVGQAVDVGGRQLNMLCSGEGQPAVIILTENARPGIAWSHIQPTIATYTRACWFDRAGEGWSDPAPFPRMSTATMRDLHRALQRAKVAPPYVLVGGSLGGLEARVYTGLYPGDVAGLVLSDAAHEEEPRRAPPAYRGHTVPQRWWRAVDLLISAAARFGIIRLATPAAELPPDPAARTRWQIVRALTAQPLAIAAVAGAGLVSSESYREAERSGDLGDRPLIVLTRGKPPDHPPRDEIERQAAAYERLWMHEIQASLARLSTHGRQVILERSGHNISEAAPEAILNAVREVVAAVRASSPLATSPARRSVSERASITSARRGLPLPQHHRSHEPPPPAA